MYDQILPVIPLRGLTVLPGEVLHCDVGRRKTLAALKATARFDGLAFFCTQKDSQQVELGEEDMYHYGTVCQIKQVFKLRGEGTHILVTGIERARIETFIENEEYFEAHICSVEDVETDPDTAEAYSRRLKETFVDYARLTNRFTAEQRDGILNARNPGRLADMIAQNVLSKVEEKQAVLEALHHAERMELVLEYLTREIEVKKIDQKIMSQVKKQVDQQQKDYYLREQAKVIQKELGEGGNDEIEEYRRRMEEKEFPEKVKARLEKEIRKLQTLPAGAHEAPMLHSYVECVLDLPWTETSQDNLDLTHAREALDANHYGMEKVKKRIVEYLAVQKLTGSIAGQILCFVGPPGVGKTSIAAAVAEAMERKFVRMSLGGVRDEAEIRGHRRTYIGAMPGRIISAMRQAETINPVLLFDEIDKMASDYKGDPASAMLEVLDGAQNFAFRDHFLELPYDLSKAMILTTANDEAGIPAPLLDRMEIIHVPSYLASEKFEIAKRHLLPKCMGSHGLTEESFHMPEELIHEIIEEYTRESGVRELERVLRAICRKAACEIGDGASRVEMTLEKIHDYLGKPKHKKDLTSETDLVGTVNGLAWTAVGGVMLQVEAAVMPGNGVLQLTGQLGEVMQESGKAAMTYIRANSASLGLEEDFYSKHDIHVHAPEGAIPKDGPSAGITITTALVSALTGIPVRKDVAMTGEVTLRGRVLPVGGLREKLLAAVRGGMHDVILSEENRPDMEDVPKDVLDALNLHFVSHVSQVLQVALLYPPQPLNSDPATVTESDADNAQVIQ